LGTIFNQIELHDQIQKWRADRKIIVFTNGCFDIIHRGHIEYLIQAKSLGDMLIIGLNSDTSVKVLKGENRPYMNQNDRAFILAHLKPVDAVSIFEEETPYNLIDIVRPDFLVKGGDYKPEQVVGRDIVESYGGEVVIIPYISGYSSSQIIDKIRRNITQGI
jgi:rfaE bifunctional protein nucleotidyltransferase chain/domain